MTPKVTPPGEATTATCDETSQVNKSYVKEYFLNEETEGVLTDTVIYVYDQHLTWLSQLKPNAKVGHKISS